MSANRGDKVVKRTVFVTVRWLPLASTPRMYWESRLFKDVCGTYPSISWDMHRTQLQPRSHSRSLTVEILHEVDHGNEVGLTIDHSGRWWWAKLTCFDKGSICDHRPQKASLATSRISSRTSHVTEDVIIIQFGHADTFSQLSSKTINLKRFTSTLDVNSSREVTPQLLTGWLQSWSLVIICLIKCICLPALCYFTHFASYWQPDLRPQSDSSISCLVNCIYGWNCV